MLENTHGAKCFSNLGVPEELLKSMLFYFDQSIDVNIFCLCFSCFNFFFLICNYFLVSISVQRILDRTLLSVRGLDIIVASSIFDDLINQFLREAKINTIVNTAAMQYLGCLSYVF